jgi:pyrimidine-specific ribonucleoside hydrolase
LPDRRPPRAQPELGADHPVGCGRGDPGPDGIAFPAPWRASSDELYGLELRAADVDGAANDAAMVMNTAITSTPTEVTIVALGPWTNLEDLLVGHPEAVGSIAGIHAMAGAIDVAGNVEVTGEPVAEWNVRADPSAFAAVLRTGIPVTLVPLDATNAVPLTPDFLDRLAEDRSAAGANVAWRLLSSNPFLMSGGQYLWDELAAIALVDPTLVRTERLRVRVDTADPGAGRLLRTDSGREIQVALSADGARAVNAIFEALRE